MSHACSATVATTVATTVAATVAATATPEDALLEKYGQAGPRYTSYPTADRFVEAYGAADYQQALALRQQLPSAQQALSLYVHIPYCQSLCHYCACNKIITKDASRAAPYIALLKQEAHLHAAALGGCKPSVSQMHFGGGTPTFCSDAELAELWAHLRSLFAFAADGEYAIEIDPRTVSPLRLKNLRDMGFNRLSLGVQDFDPAVQKAVHREQSYESVAQLIDAARALGFASVNMDLIYGLPQQSPASLARTLAQVIALRPERIALYAYAHLPQRFKPQRRIAEQQLPSAADKLAMFKLALATLQDAGYDYIGMDHFALPSDSLAAAKRQGRLHRNFQGYSTQPDCDLIALGVSAIGKVGMHYSQNAKTLEEYQDLLELGQIPIVRGLVLSRDDALRRCLIMAIMCQGEVDFASVNAAWLCDFERDFAPELEQLHALAADGLLQLRADGFSLSATGWLLVRAVAMVFDKPLQADLQRTRYSQII
jgi:oxygen-independent coproporphyrinogen-3 oxidase